MLMRATPFLVLLGLTAAAPPPAAPEPKPVMSASVASLKKIDALAKEIGFPNVRFFSATFIEDQIPFIGAGGLASDRPLGVRFYLEPGVDLEKGATFILPVNPGKAELKTFLERGAQPVDERADLVKLGDIAYRRGKDQFMF